MKTKSGFIRKFVMMIVMALSALGAMAQQTYISDVYIRWGGEYKWSDKDPLPDGYIMIDQDLNEGSGGDYVYLCYKTTTDIREAITDLIIASGRTDDNKHNGKNNYTMWIYGRAYHAAAYSKNSNGGQLNQGRTDEGNSPYTRLWLYYTKQGSSDIKVCKPSAITSLKLEWDDNHNGKDSYLGVVGTWVCSNAHISQRYKSTFSVEKEYLYIDVTRSSDENHIGRKLTESKEPTCATDGYIENWRCIDCGRYFDYNYDTEYSPEEVVIPALGHDWDKEKMTYDENTGAWNLDCNRCQYHEARKMMCITANEDNVNVRLNSQIDPYYDDLDYYEDYYQEPDVYYMKNGDGDGGPLTSALSKGVEMNKGDMLWLFGRDTNEFYRNEENRTWFEINGSVSCTGNVTSICDETGDYGYLHTSLCGVFNSTGLDKSPRLNATNLYYDCYDGIFRDCPNLKDVTICDANKDQIESAITNNWLRGTASNGIVHITDELALANANLQLPANWRTDKVVVAAKEDPTEGQAGNYYATYYDSQSEYSVKEGTKAYTGTVEGDALNMTAEADNIIPAGEGVLLKGNTPDVILTLSDTNKETTPGNMLRGSDTDTSAPANCYIFTYAQNGLGFYQYAAGKSLGAHKAYLQTVINNARGFRMVFDDGTTTGIDPLLYPSKGDDAIYNLQGVRMNKLQKGINIVNGKKVVIKSEK